MNYLEEARLSGLVFGKGFCETPQWAQEKEEWRRYAKVPHRHAMVVVYPTNRNPKEEIVVLVGGGKNGSNLTSVLLRKGMADWQEGPPLNQGRLRLSAVVCNGNVYAIGGGNYNFTYSYLDTVERIGLVDLISLFSTSTKKSSCLDNGENQGEGWETLKCRLSDYRCLCSAVVADKRYILVAGGRGWYAGALTSVEIIDTATPTQETKEPCSIFSGPPLTVTRECFAMEVIGRRVYAVGGYVDSVEYLDLNDSGPSTTDNKNTSSSKSWSGLSWTKHRQLKLFDHRWDHAIVRDGSCVVISGGKTGSSGLAPVGTMEVLDTKRNKVWTLPHRTPCSRSMHILVARSNGIAVIGFAPKCSWSEFTFYKERLPLMDKNSALFLWLLDKPHLVEINIKCS